MVEINVMGPDIWMPDKGAETGGAKTNTKKLA